MTFEEETLTRLLKTCGITHKLKKRIKPSTHPYMKILMNQLNKHNVSYMYFDSMDGLSITTEFSDKSFNALSNTYITASSIGLDVYISVQDERFIEDVITLAETTLGYILSEKVNFRILGLI